jgi:hypothetical protein
VSRLRAGVAIVVAQALVWAPLARADEPEPEPKPPEVASPDGVPVTFLSKSASTRIYVAHGDYGDRPDPDPFKKVGMAPVTVRLPPGTYTVETEGPTQSNGHQRFVVEHDAPLTVQVHPGDPSLKTVGGILIALGVVSIALGIVTILSISKDDSHFDRWGIGLPLCIGGAAGAGLGWGVTAAGSTDVDAPHLPPGGLAHPAALIPRLVLKF